MTLTIDTETDARRALLKAAHRMLTAFEDIAHQTVPLPYGLVPLSIHVCSAIEREQVESVLRSWDFTFDPLEDAGSGVDEHGRKLLQARAIRLDGGPVVTHLVASRECFLPSTAATVGLIGAVFGTSAPWADEAPEDDDDYEPEPDDADELYRDDDPLAYVTTVDPLVRS